MRASQSGGRAVPERPLSPHLTIYRMSRYSLLSSISNRAAGLLLALGQLLLVYFLLAAASGGRTYERAAAVLASAPLKVCYALLLAAFAYHLIAGVRHLIWDAGYGLERRESRVSAAWVASVALLLAAGLIGWAFLAGAAAR